MDSDWWLWKMREKGNANATKDDNDINHNVSDDTTAIANY